MATCEYIGAEQTEWPYTPCGCATLTGKVYCGEHYFKVYQKGSAIAGRRAEKAVEQEIAEMSKQQTEEEETYE